MALEAVAGLFDWVTGAAARTGLAWFRRATAAELLGSLDEDGRAAFLELLVCAALDDGEISDAELKMFVKRADDVGRKEVQAALDRAHDARPFADPGEYAAFLAACAERLPSVKQRRAAFSACLAILVEANAPDLAMKAKLYGEALGVPEAERARIQNELLEDAGAKGKETQDG